MRSARSEPARLRLVLHHRRSHCSELWLMSTRSKPTALLAQLSAYRGKSEFIDVGIRTTCETFPALCVIFSRGLPPPRQGFAIFVPSFVKES